MSEAGPWDTPYGLTVMGLEEAIHHLRRAFERHRDPDMDHDVSMAIRHAVLCVEVLTVQDLLRSHARHHPDDEDMQDVAAKVDDVVAKWVAVTPPREDD